jgi:arginine-tRNA-protein transferase
MSDSIKLRFGITETVPCQYIPGEFERLVVLADEQQHDNSAYQHLLAHGFRRCGNSLYAPHCPECNACQSIRIPVALFSPSRNQRRTQRLGDQRLTVKIATEVDKTAFFPLYSRYIETRHADGGMSPVSFEQYENFLFCQWHKPLFISFYEQNSLVAVAVTDNLAQGLSAVYTFFDPDYSKLSLGTYAIMRQIELAKSLQKPFLYLGFQIDDCPAMRYKIRFKPYQLLENGDWSQYD